MLVQCLCYACIVLVGCLCGACVVLVVILEVHVWCLQVHVWRLYVACGAYMVLKWVHKHHISAIRAPASSIQDSGKQTHKRPQAQTSRAVSPSVWM